jgi:hypothetical protein
MNQKIPCEECLLVPICRYKDYRELVRNCLLIFDLLYFDRLLDSTCRTSDFRNKVLGIEQTVKPTRWFIKRNGTGTDDGRYTMIKSVNS